MPSGLTVLAVSREDLHAYPTVLGRCKGTPLLERMAEEGRAG